MSPDSCLKTRRLLRSFKWEQSLLSSVPLYLLLLESRTQKMKRRTAHEAMKVAIRKVLADKGRGST